MDYSDPILQETIAVFCQDIEKKWPQQYSNAKVGMNFGFAFPPSIFKIFRENKMQVFAFDNNEIALKYLQLKKIDCYVNDRDAVIYSNNLLRLPPLKEISTLAQENSYLGFSQKFSSKYKFKDDFIKNFNTHLQKIKENGTLNSIVSDFLKKTE